MRNILIILIVAILAFLAGSILGKGAGASIPSTSDPHTTHNVFPLPQKYPLTTTFYDSVRSDGTVRYGRSHWDIACPADTDVLSPCSGVVVQVGWLPDIGNHIYILDKDGNVNRLGHFRALNWFEVKVGTEVEEGQLIGYSGGSDAARGHSTGAHLHWQVFDSKGVPICPTDYLKR